MSWDIVAVIHDVAQIVKGISGKKKLVCDAVMSIVMFYQIISRGTQCNIYW